MPAAPRQRTFRKQSVPLLQRLYGSLTWRLAEIPDRRKGLRPLLFPFFLRSRPVEFSACYREEK